MPWKIVPDHPQCDGKFAVVKEDNGEVEGCHETEEAAQAQQRALYASEKGGDALTTIKSIASSLEELLVSLWQKDSASPEASKDKVDSQGDVPSIADGGPSFRVWKQGDTYRWLALYSNNFRDEDAPPEIISAESHRNFVKMVDEGAIPKPELWLWHTEGTAFGDADMVDFTDEGIAVASGTVRKGKEYVAEALTRMSDLGVSHGMDIESIERDALDSSVITKHVTREISPLPLWAAANKRTRFAILRKGERMMSDEKREFLRGAGLTDDEIQAVDQTGKELAQEAQSAGVESKEADIPTPDFATKQEVAEAMAAIVESLATQLTELSGRIEGVDTAIKSLQRTDEDRFRQVKESTPRASILDLMKMGPVGSAEVSESDPLKARKPAETPVHQTGIDFIDKMLAGV